MVTGLSKEHRGVKRYSVLVFSIGMILTIFITHLVYKGQQQLANSNFEFLANNQAENIKELVMLDVGFIGAGASFYHATQPPTWDNFSTFVAPLLADSKSLIAMQWMKKVYPEQIDSHVKKVREHFPRYQIYTVPKGKPRIDGYILENEEPIYVASDVYPVNEGNLRALGYYSSRERVRRVIDSTLATGEPSLSDKIRLLQDGFDRSLPKQGMLVYHPVFEVGGQSLRGVVIGVIRTTVYFEQIVSRTSIGKEVGVRVVDLGFDAEDDPVMYQNTNWDSLNTQSKDIVIDLYDRQWKVQFKHDSEISQTDRIILICVASGGFVISLLLAYVVQLMLREQRRLTQLVNRRTRDLQYLVERDPLTEVYNRRAFNRLADYHIACDKPFSLVIIDIDKFKQINDRFGHVVGDEILMQIAAYISEQLYPDDLLFRLGGDEFAVISRCIDYSLLDNYLNEVCQKTRTLTWDTIDPEFVCTLSVGAAVYRGESLEQLINRADEQLYISKAKGRNMANVA
ncbi:sensor domain-containing diguanylate cyclase [Vibrio hangzhouensis]|uniref:sensor domain-containing diguanylate cyclase n=1 Tax=Vibrio hangzhouensis TaxID=462991 RepID=UPI001C96FAD8|nr:sensor domain-containing diguanylate cyclase [Vibrio hangzhouensis]MBY6196767.1 sensor domain-containing diguanylate cyclase [Vibrio hangzhouensis]